MTTPRPRVSGLRARYVHRISADDVGQRVSIRRLVDEPERGPVPADIVGRLVAADEEVLLVVDRHHQLHAVDVGDVLASRVVPAHPTRAPEPPVGTPEAPLARSAARTLLLDPEGRVLLIAHAPGDGRRVWTAPGGGVRAGEDHRQAAARELLEETGIEASPGEWVWQRRVTFSYRGCWIEQDERWYLTQVSTAAPAPAAPPDPGTTDARWWRTDELRTTTDELAPAALADHLEALLAFGPPIEPVDVGR